MKPAEILHRSPPIHPGGATSRLRISWGESHLHQLSGSYYLFSLCCQAGVVYFKKYCAKKRTCTKNPYPLLSEKGQGATFSRKEIIDIFNSLPGFGCMILSPLAAGVGLNITGANHVIHFTRWWNPAVENQATDRVHRLGQEKEVHIYYPIMTSSEIGATVEEELARLIEDKRYLSKSIIVPNKLPDDQIYNELTNMLNREVGKLDSA